MNPPPSHSQIPAGPLSSQQMLVLVQPTHPSAGFVPNTRFPTSPASFPLLSSSVRDKPAVRRLLLCTAWAPVPERPCRVGTEEAQGSDESLSQGPPKGPGMAEGAN